MTSPEKPGGVALPVIIAVIVVALLVVGFVGWRSVSGGSPDRVPVSAEDVKAGLKDGGGFGHK